ncbi:MAG: alpha/beta hydrolase [Robiginitomaculum sp.]|nr:MAG: alpha/beta hydrolase [Robiginitomaculum sp.]PHQ66791.1 MAG: alpha/beta hydrolase [Robiginitomaculum sp.]PHS76456.1 MAG: alpha/beta hydrolase [Robiginitomaculum sp.]
MPEVIFAGPEGRLEGRYHPSDDAAAPCAIVLSPHPKAGGHMDHRIPVAMYECYKRRGFSVLRFNFRGIGRSKGVYDHGSGELQDAAYALDYLQSFNQNAPFSWVTGYSFGAWIGMQLLMRRPEVAGFISMSLPTNTYDLAFLAPCPASGLITYGSLDSVVPPEEVERAIENIRIQKGQKIYGKLIEGADHFYSQHLDIALEEVEKYLDKALDEKYSPPREPGLIGFED